MGADAYPEILVSIERATERPSDPHRCVVEWTNLIEESKRKNDTTDACQAFDPDSALW